MSSAALLVLLSFAQATPEPPRGPVRIGRFSTAQACERALRQNWERSRREAIDFATPDGTTEVGAIGRYAGGLVQYTETHRFDGRSIGARRDERTSRTLSCLGSALRIETDPPTPIDQLVPSVPR